MSFHRHTPEDNQRRRAIGVVLDEARRERDRTGPAGELKILEDALQTLGPSWRILAAHGEALERTGRPEQARWSFDRAITAGDRTGLSHYRAGRILLQQGRLPQADARFEQAAALEDKMPEAWYGRGLVAWEEHRYADAAAYFDKAAEREPAWPEPRWWAAQALNQVGRTHEAIQRYGSLLDDPAIAAGTKAFHGRVLCGWAESLAKLGRHSEALETAERGLEQLDESEDSNRLRIRLSGVAFDAAWRSKQFSRMGTHGSLLLRHFEPVDAMSVYAAYLSAAADQADYPAAWSNLAHIGRMYAESTEELARRDLDSELWVGLAFMLMLLGEYDEADLALDTALRKARHDDARASVYLQMVTVCFERRDEVEAEDWLTLHRRGLEAARVAESILLSQLATERSAAVLHDLGNLYLVLENHEQAQYYLRQALDADPAIIDTRARLGIACAALGDGTQAIRLLRDCLAVDPLQVEWRMSLAWAYRLEGALDRAEEELWTIKQSAPGHLSAEVALAEVLISRGDEGDDEALVEAERMLAASIEQSRDTAVRPPGQRVTAGRLASRREAQALYARGYALVRLSERPGIRSGNRRGFGSALRAAERLFEESARKDPSTSRASRAREAVRDYRRTTAASRRVERIAVPLLVVAEVILLAAVQAGFVGWLPGARLEPGYYVLVTFGLLVLIIATVYLPSLLRLKVVGVEMEKAVDDTTGSMRPLDLTNAPSLEVSRVIARQTKAAPVAPPPGERQGGRPETDLAAAEAVEGAQRQRVSADT
jgi:tetratricopeptide (TPR) repeat protein